MPKLTVPLTEAQVRNAKGKEKPYKLFDGGGLYLEVMPSGSRIWRLKFRQPNGKENRLTFGPYPEVTLQDPSVHWSYTARSKSGRATKNNAENSIVRAYSSHCWADCEEQVNKRKRVTADTKVQSTFVFTAQ